MVYAVDIVIDIIKDISPSMPVMFQRDGCFYVASPKGFGIVTYGLPSVPESRDERDKSPQPASIAESEDIMLEWAGDEYDKKPRFRKGEEKYLKPLVFGPDDNSFSLEEMARAATQLGMTGNDSKIIMVDHATGYHSHKHGYACDGIDVDVHSARVMPRERYLELIREMENDIMHRLEGFQCPRGYDFGSAYNRQVFPDCAILTENLKLSFPRRGTLSRLFNEVHDSWNARTRLQGSYESCRNGNIIRTGEVSTYKESPFVIDLALNAARTVTSDAAQLFESAAERDKAVRKEMMALSGHLGQIGTFLDRLNEIHDRLCEKDIRSMKDLLARHAAKK